MNTAAMARTTPVPLELSASPTVGTAQIIPLKAPRPAAAAATPIKPPPQPLAPPLAIIRLPAHNVNQAGRRDSGWVLEFEPAQRPLPDPLMGWSGSGDVYSAIRIRFPTRASAERFAQRAGLPYVVVARPAPALRGLDVERRLSS
jgi:hypothetical protein